MPAPKRNDPGTGKGLEKLILGRELKVAKKIESSKGIESSAGIESSPASHYAQQVMPFIRFVCKI